MKVLLFVVCILLANGAFAARSLFEMRCEHTIRKPGATLTARQSGYSIDNTRSYRALTSMKSPRAAGNAFVLGLTSTEARMDFAMDGARLNDWFSSNECISPKLAVTLYYAPIVIYIGREFAPGTCSYREILAHEMRHLKTYLEHLPKVEAVVRAALVKRFDSQLLYAPAGQGTERLQREIDGAWIPFIKAEMAKVERLQAAIDTPQEYARLSRVCKGEVQSLIAAAVPPG